jgi:hypothetical protein
MFCGVMGHRFVLSLIGPVWAVDQSYWMARRDTSRAPPKAEIAVKAQEGS